MSKIFNLKPDNIIDLNLKLDGKLPVNRDELLALVNSWGRDDNLYTYDKKGNDIIIEKSRSNEKYNLSNLDVSQIRYFDNIFHYSKFNGDINGWDVSNAISMVCMFNKNKKFNSPLDKWDTSNVTSMYSMFAYTKEFNQPLDKWNVSKVENMGSMFVNAKKFNLPLNSWNVSKVTDISYMFNSTNKFNQNINSWNISNVVDIEYIFANTEVFNQPVLLNISHIKYCKGMFYKSKLFKNQFNNKNELPYYTNELKDWLIENRDRMMALNIEKSKGKELNKFLLNISLQNKSFIEKLFIKFKYL